MNFTQWIETLQTQPLYASFVVLGLSVIAFVIFRYLVARWFMGMARRSANKYDDILMKYMRPYRVAWLAPLIVIHLAAGLFPEYQVVISKVALFLILWLSAITLVSILNAINVIYESRPNYKGVSIAGYLDIGKILVMAVALILSITLITDKSPTVLLTSLGAMAAVLLLIFQGTILSLVSSIQIAANDLIKEGDWIEVPSYDADGDVVNINLHTIKVRNFDMTYTIIPTDKILDVSFRNWRGMVESGGRRIQRSVLLDQTSVQFCSLEMMRELQKIDLLADWLAEKITALEAYASEHHDHYDLPLDGPQVTNSEIYRTYIEAYLRKRPEIHSENLPFLVRTLAPKPDGLPIELYVFTKTTKWEEYEVIQSSIFDHLLAAVHVFGLRVFQEPTGLDFREGVKARG